MNAAFRQVFTIDPVAAGTTKAPDATIINIGPLELEGPTIGIQDIGFSDGLLVITIGVGFNRGSLAFGSSGNSGGSSQQSSSGITAEMLGVLGTFDLALDAFGLLSGNVRVEPTGAFGLQVGSLEIDVPDAVNVRAQGIEISYDFDNIDHTLIK